MNYDSYRTVMKTDLLEGMQPSGEWDLATIHRSNARPNRLVPFDRAVSSREADAWVHFFVHDIRFSRILRDPWRYLPILARFEGVIAPDCSVFWGHPRYRQLQSIALSREIGSWLQRNGVPVIPCVRWGKQDTYDFAFDGIAPGGTVAVGTVGAMRDGEARRVFEAGFEPMIKAVEPRCIVVYGSRKSPVFEVAEQQGVEVLQYDSETAKAFSKRSA